MVRFALTIFLSAFLLFQVQPLIGKYILPWFGGTPSVWTTCMLFFQMLLLGGYSYAHLLASRLSSRKQAGFHLGLLAVSLVFLQLFPPSETWKPAGAESPTLRILLLLGATIGFPYLVLSATGPLLQEWFRRAQPGRSPYRLYALSNAGSLLALLTYPFAIEPSLRLGVQATVWTIGYALFVACCAWCAARLIWPANDEAPARLEGQHATEEEQPVRLRPDPYRPSAGDVVMWLLLSACGSAMLLATTNQMCQEVAVVPFLWVLPLAIYLISFIICFDNPLWYARGTFAVTLGISAVLGTVALHLGMGVDLWMQILIYSTVLFAVCMSCHGELVNSRPHPRHLTLFYLMISAGGALGGVLVALVAPAVFRGFWEYHVVLAASCLAVMAALFRDRGWILYGGRPLWAWSVFATAWVVLVLALGAQVWKQVNDAIYLSRNFYGALKVRGISDSEAAEEHTYALMHGRTLHGLQYLAPDRRHWATTYYGADSGIGLAIEHHPRRAASDPKQRALRIGVVGLGTGTIAALARPGDYLRFYEINPQVLEISGDQGEFFTFIADSPAEHDIVLGDARVQMEREIADGDLQQFDVLAIDAFSSDAIPMHLLTQECLEVYWKHLKSDGILALHISNRHLNLEPVCRGLAKQAGHEAIYIESKADEDKSVFSPDWILVTDNQQFLNTSEISSVITPWNSPDVPPLVWTDDYGALGQILKAKPELPWPSEE